MTYRLCTILALLLASSASVFAQQPRNLINGDTSAMQPFSFTWRGNQATEQQGRKPAPWGGNCWHQSGVGRFSLEDGPEGRRAFALRNLDGRPSLQVTTWRAIPLRAGRQYTIALRYATVGGASGRLQLRAGREVVAEQGLADSGGQWRSVERTFAVTQGQPVKFNIQPTGRGEDVVLYLADIRLVDAGGGAGG